MLSFDAEEEAACEGGNIADAWCPRFVPGSGRFEVTVGKEDEPPEDGEAQPGKEEVHREDQERPTPLRIHQGGEDVL